MIVHSPEAKEEFKNNIQAETKITYAEQKEPLGTAHAVKTALPYVTTDNFLVLLGDVPLLSESSIIKIKEGLESNKLVILTAHVKDPTGYGRISKDREGKPSAIIEPVSYTHLTLPTKA